MISITLKRSLLGLFAIATMATSLSTHAEGGHLFQNKSNYPWFVEFVGSSNSMCGSELNRMRRCVVQPNSSINLYYDYAVGLWSPQLNIYSATIPYNMTFMVRGNYIAHDGRTGAVTLNEPGYGHIRTCEGDCQKYLS